MTNSVLIIGASVAGIGAANELRRCGFEGAITLVDSQPHLPYDRPPLSKDALFDLDLRCNFHDPAHYDDLGIALHLGGRAVQLRPEEMAVELADGVVLSAEAIILATGARARRFPATMARGMVHTIRDWDDACALRQRLAPGMDLAIIGGGFIGLEAASSAAKRGVRVTLVSAPGMPLEHALGRSVASRILRLFDDSGVTIETGVFVKSIDGAEESGSLLRLEDGREIRADVVLAGLGSLPNVEWLQGSGVTIEGGVRCDSFGRTGLPNIYAAGDTAAWPGEEAGTWTRHEHWTAAREQARLIAQHITAKSETAWSDFIPYFWSDVQGKRVQLLGSAEGADVADFVFEDVEKGHFVAEYFRGGKLIGVAGLNAGARIMRYAPRLRDARIANAA